MYDLSPDFPLLGVQINGKNNGGIVYIAAYLLSVCMYDTSIAERA